MSFRDANRFDLDVRLVLEGQVATFEVSGGFVRKAVPTTGVVVETTTTTIFIPLATLVEVVGNTLQRPEAPDATP